MSVLNFDSNILMLVALGFILVGAISAAYFIMKGASSEDREEDDEEEVLPAKTSSRNDDTASQLRILVSASRVSGTYARDQVTKQAAKSSLTDLSDLKELKSKLEKSLDLLDLILNSGDNYSYPIAAGKAAKLQVLGNKVLQVMKSREEKVDELFNTLKSSSEKIKELIRQPYVLKNDVYIDLKGSKDNLSIPWDKLDQWLTEFNSDVLEVKQSIVRTSKAV